MGLQLVVRRLAPSVGFCPDRCAIVDLVELTSSGNLRVPRFRKPYLLLDVYMAY